MMQITIEGVSVERGGDGPSPGLLQEALALCSTACSKVRNLCHVSHVRQITDPHLMNDLDLSGQMDR